LIHQGDGQKIYAMVNKGWQFAVASWQAACGLAASLFRGIRQGTFFQQPNNLAEGSVHFLHLQVIGVIDLAVDPA
jgi:hypothetical protein